MNGLPGATTKGMRIAGWVIGCIPAAMLLLSGVMKIMRLDTTIEMLTGLGYSESVIAGIGVAEVCCAVLYLVPTTAVLGAILATGFLGGATASHVRVGEYATMFVPVATAAMFWLGLVLRDARLRAVLPWRSRRG